MVQSPSGEALIIKGEKLCLNFVNTVGWRGSSHPEERLTCFDDLLLWSKRAEILTDEQYIHLLALAKQQPRDAEHVYLRGLQLREALYRLFLSTLSVTERREADLDLFNQEHRAALTELQVTAAKGEFVLLWPEEENHLDSPLWHVSKSAGEIFTSEALQRVRLCAGMDCGWLFFDQSKNHSRKWCDGKMCGNRDRVRRHYQQSHPRIQTR